MMLLLAVQTQTKCFYFESDFWPIGIGYKRKEIIRLETMTHEEQLK